MNYVYDIIHIVYIIIPTCIYIYIYASMTPRGWQRFLDLRQEADKDSPTSEAEASQTRFKEFLEDRTKE